MTSFSWKALFHLVFLFWVVMDSLGTLPIFVSLLKHFDPAKQKKIITRELLIALVIMIIFLYFGQGFFTLFKITPSSLEMAGGIILFILALKMIFSTHAHEKKESQELKDPLIVPLAVPSIAGPGILATITLYGGGLGNSVSVLVAIIIAWLLSFIVLIVSPQLNKYLGDNGVIAVERLFGYILILISTQMALHGLLTALHA
jgi:multiple antibiotic resistance protein